MDAHWLKITTYSDHIGFTISTLANLALLILLAIRPTKAIGSYRYLMISFCVFSLFYTSIETFLRPLIHIYDNTIFVIQRKRFQYSETIARAISSTYCGCYAMSFTLFAVHFVYRYYATCKPDLLRFFNGFYFVAWVFGAIIVAASWGFAAFILYPETDRTKAALLHILNTSYNLDPDWVGNVPYSYTIIPTFLMYLPTTMLFVTPFFGLNIGCYGNITTATVHLYPGLDPLVLLLLIRDFRQTIKRKIFFWAPATSRVETQTNVKSIQSSASRVG
ncbi:hypothetical protein B9Z55_017496 [Caenorhabditis nigoni]|uniref:G-protein coupled receptors family 1 profile domain-containing protein n=1 Tax=Caenorhabditis nigoni TaxID=1611254 RepID=A0A2G5T9Z2_9PELO|nr:hypothetical protein B9Z55_017496 [Caenorhabditis nigoni]